MKILIFGKNGQIGIETVKLLKPYYEIFKFGSKECNFCDFKKLKHYILSIKPDIVINCAAYTKVDLAEKEKALCYKVNATALKIIGKAANSVGALVIHYSTDYVFNGLKQEPYFETDQPDPISEYGRSKLCGEILLKQFNDKIIIIRTSWVFSKHKNNFLTTILKKINEGNYLSIINDQFGSPTSASLISEMTKNIIDKYAQDKILNYGIFNISSEGITTWYEFAKEIANKYKIVNNFEKKIIIDPITSDQYPTLAVRPKYSVLSNNYFKSVFKTEVPFWSDQIERELLK